MKGNKIIELYDDNNEINLLKLINGLISKGNYLKAISESKKALKSYPDNSLFYTSLAVAYSVSGHSNDAMRVLKLAEEKFPDDFDVLFQLAKLYEDIKDYSKAEDYYKKSYDATPSEFNDACSDCLNDLGVVYWLQGFKEDALEQWKLALIEDPNNLKAKQNIDAYTNEFGEPASVSKVTDDMWHFQKIQTDKYLKLKNKKEFTAKKEAESVFKIIFKAWNEKIAFEHEKLDKMQAGEKTAWFKSIDIKFEDKPPKYDGLTNDDSDLLDESMEYLNEQFDYLPKDSFILLPLLKPLLEEAGLNQKRFRQIADGANPSDAEIDIMQWACDVAFELGPVIENKNKKDIELIREEAIEIAAEYVPRVKAREILPGIEQAFLDLFTKAIFPGGK